MRSFCFSKMMSFQILQHCCITLSLILFVLATNLLWSIFIPCFRFNVYLTNRRFFTSNSRPTGWTHVLLNYIGPNNGQGIRIYYNGEQVASDTRKSNLYSEHQPGNGRIVVGRYYTNKDQRYASVEIDELVFFNNSLNLEEIEYLSTVA